MDANEKPGTDNWRVSELPADEQAELRERLAEAQQGANLLPGEDAIVAAKRLSDEIAALVRPAGRAASK